MAFHIHEAGTGADTFIQGQGLGANYLSVVFDTYNNADHCSVDWGMAVYNNGSPVGSCLDLRASGPPDPWAYDVEMTHDDASDFLTVKVTQTAIRGRGLYQQTYAVDLSALDEATFGWSGQTGGDGENHDVVKLQRHLRSRAWHGAAPRPRPGRSRRQPTAAQARASPEQETAAPRYGWTFLALRCGGCESVEWRSQLDGSSSSGLEATLFPAPCRKGGAADPSLRDPRLGHERSRNAR